jgi:hypothetical protein
MIAVATGGPRITEKVNQEYQRVFRAIAAELARRRIAACGIGTADGAATIFRAISLDIGCPLLPPGRLPGAALRV